jgi:predicted secreted Zn-dependent protease
MAKKKKPDMSYGLAVPTYKPPTKAEIVRTEAKYIGQRIADADPKVKKMKDEISKKIEQAIKSAVK